jgi:GNAT superfamily N-acetyltransferase
MVTWTVPAGADAGRASDAFFSAYHRAAFPQGWLWVVGDGRVDGMALWVPADAHDAYEDVMRGIDAEVGRIMGERKPTYDRFWAWVDEHRPAEPHWYLEHIAVEPARRGSGLGRSLIDHGLTHADAERSLAWLATSRPGNVPLYERFGFDVEAAEDAPDGGPRLWFMRRAPIASRP